MCSGRVINMSPGRGESWREYMWNEIFMWQWCEQFSEMHIIRNTGAAGATGGKWLMASASYGRRIVRKIRPGVRWRLGANGLEEKTRCLLMLERGCRLMLRFRKSGKSEVSRDNAGVFPDRKVRNRKSSVSSSLGRFGAWEYHHSIRVKILDRLSLSELFQLTHTWLPHASTLGPNPGIENRLYLLP